MKCDSSGCLQHAFICCFKLICSLYDLDVDRKRPSGENQFLLTQADNYLATPYAQVRAVGVQYSMVYFDRFSKIKIVGSPRFVFPVDME